MFMRTIQVSFFVDMLTCSDEVQPSTALFYIASQQSRQTEVNIHPISSLAKVAEFTGMPSSKYSMATK